MNALTPSGSVPWTRLTASRTASAPTSTSLSDHVHISSSESRQGARILVSENEWYVAEEGHDYIVATGGCGAIKAFVDAGESSYAIVFHSDGSQDSKEVAAPQISNYILRQKERPRSVRLLSIQPYSQSKDVMDSVNGIGNRLEQAGISSHVHAVTLNNIDAEDHSQFVYLNLRGTEKQILDRYSDLRIKSRELSKEDRAKKIALFQSLPAQVRTSEFIKEWSTLSLEEAGEVVAGVRRQKTSIWERILSSL